MPVEGADGTWRATVPAPLEAAPWPALRIEAESTTGRAVDATLVVSWRRPGWAMERASGSATWRVSLHQRRAHVFEVARNADGPCFDCYRGRIEAMTVSLHAPPGAARVHGAALFRPAPAARARMALARGFTEGFIVPLLLVAAAGAFGALALGGRRAASQWVIGIAVAAAAVHLAARARELPRRSWAFAPYAPELARDRGAALRPLVETALACQDDVPLHAFVELHGAGSGRERGQLAGFLMPLRTFIVQPRDAERSYPSTRFLMALGTHLFAATAAPSREIIGLRFDSPPSTTVQTLRCTPVPGSNDCLFDAPLSCRETLGAQVTADAPARYLSPPAGYRTRRLTPHGGLFERGEMPCTR